MKRIWPLLTATFGLLSHLVWAQPGLVGAYYNGTNFEQKVLTRVDPQVSFDWTGRSPVNGLKKSYYSIRWTGKLLAPVSGVYQFSATVDDGIRLWVGNTKVIEAWGLHDNVNFKGSITLEAGKYYDLRVDYFNDLLGGMIDLLWYRPDDKAKNPPFRDQFGRPIGDPTSYHPITGQYLYRTVPPPPKPVVPPPKPVVKPIARVTPPAPKPASPIRTKPVSTPPPRPNPVPPNLAPPVPIPSTPDPKTFGNLDVGKPLVLQSVFFEQSTYHLLPESFPELDKLVRTLQQHPTVRIEIAGHTDNVGDSRLNQALSEYRARVVMNYLIQHGIADTRVEAIGYGGSRPLTGNTTEQERAQNRRVEFVVK